MQEARDFKDAEQEGVMLPADEGGDFNVGFSFQCAEKQPEIVKQDGRVGASEANEVIEGVDLATVIMGEEVLDEPMK